MKKQAEPARTQTMNETARRATAIIVTTRTLRSTHVTERTAYHEAGHAVVAHRYKLGLREVSIVEDETTEGRVRTNRLPKWLFPYGELDLSTPRAQVRIESEILCDLAGLAAERRHFRKRHWRGGQGDTSNAVRLADSMFGGSTRVLEAYLKYMMVRAEELIALPLVWRPIVAVAKQLIKRQEISGDEAREIILAAMKP